jgi:hypothetical protein
MKVLRYSAGPVILGLLAAAAYLLYVNQPPACAVCHRPIHQATFYRIHLSSGEIEDICCPRCGLHFQLGRTDIAGAEAADFVTGERFQASEAYYVENSSVHLCCSEDPVEKDWSGTQYSLTWDRCLPSLVAFKSREEAAAFVRQNGGVFKSYEELLAESF